MLCSAALIKQLLFNRLFKIPIKLGIAVALITLFPTTLIAKTYVVLNISSYHKEYTWTEQCTSAIKEELGSNFEVHTFYMDTKRIPSTEFSGAADKAWKFYQSLNPDIVLIGDDNALLLLGPRLKYETSKIVIFYGINGNPRHYFTDMAVPPHFGGILEKVSLVSLIRNVAYLLQNDAKKRFLVLSNKKMSASHYFHKKLLDQGRAEFAGFEIQYKLTNGWSDWKSKATADHRNFSAIFLDNFFNIKDNGIAIPSEDVLHWTINNTELPVFILQNRIGKNQAVGAIFVDGKEHGKKAAELTKLRISGKIGKVIWEDRGGEKMVLSKSELERHKIQFPETKLARFKIVE